MSLAVAICMVSQGETIHIAWQNVTFGKAKRNVLLSALL